MIYYVGELIPLALKLFKNDRPYAGQDITVQVKSVLDASLLLAETVTIESEPGLYSYFWNTPPENPADLMVVFKRMGTQYTQGIRIIKGPDDFSGSNPIFGEIMGEDQFLAGTIGDDQESISGSVLEDSESMAGIILGTDLTGEILDTEEPLGGDISSCE